MLAALLTVGRVSDHIGRRPVLFGAIALQASAMVVFATAHGVPALMAGRIIQGLATGAAAGAIGAGLLDLDKARGTVANGVAPIVGTATGALGSALLVQYLPAPTHLVYLVLFAIFVAQGAGVVLMRESSSPKPGALASLRPQFALPPAARRPFALAVPVLVAVWALPGFYGSLGPSLVRTIVGSNSVVLGGLALFELAATAAITVALIRTTAPRTVMLLGNGALVVGVAITFVAIEHLSALEFFVGTAVAGVGFGAGFQGALRSVIPFAAPHERAGVLSTIYVVCYLAMGLPAVIAGFLVVHGGGLVATAREYVIAVVLLSGVALAGTVTRRPTRQTARPESLPCSARAQRAPVANRSLSAHTRQEPTRSGRVDSN